MDHRGRRVGAPALGAVPPARRRAVGLTLPATAGRWTVERWQGSAAEAHGRPWPAVAVPAMRVVDVPDPALVLGSSQDVGGVDVGAAIAAGIAVVRRRSGGGAVLVGGGRLVWVDLFVPTGDRLWHHDVGRAPLWVGRLWAAALADLGTAAGWHEGPLVSTPWSPMVCFAGMGPGEVEAGGAKVVGVSSRRTRAGALFQCAALLRWEPEAIVGLLALSGRERDAAARELTGVAAPLPFPPEELESALVHRLADL